MKKNQPLKLSIFVFLAIFLVSFLIPLTAQAADIVAKALLWALNVFFTVVNTVIGFIGGLLFSLASMFVNMALELNTKIVSGNNPIVSIGWNIVRDIANLGFVLVIIIIAFATIFRIEQWGMRSLLFKLILAAVLVNFSLFIGKVFIDFSNVITNFFLNAANVSGSPGGLASALADAFSIQKLIMASANPEVPTPPPDFSTVGEAFFIGIASIVFTLLFVLLGAFVLFILGGLFFIRFIFLSFLLIISPITWLFEVVPQWKGLASTWWSKFIEWVFFAPAASFFIYLSLRAVEEMKNVPLIEIKSQMFLGLAGPLETIFTAGASMFLILGIMVGGLIASQKMGIAGAAGAVEWGKKVGGAVGKWGKEKAKGRVRDVRDRLLTGGLKTETDAEGKTKVTTRAERIASTSLFGKELRAIPIFGKPFSAISTASTKAKERAGKSVDAEVEKLKSETPENLAAGNDRLVTGALPTIDKLAARGLVSAGKGVWDKIPANIQNRMLDAIRRTGKENELLKHRPDLAAKLNKDLNQAIQDIPNITRLSREAQEAIFKNPDLVNYLKPQHLEQAGYELSVDLKENTVASYYQVLGGGDETAGKTLLEDIQNKEKDINSLKKDIDDFKLTYNPAKKADKAKMKNLIDQRKTAEQDLKDLIATKVKSDPKKDKAYANLQTLQTSVSWQDAKNLVKKP